MEEEAGLVDLEAAEAAVVQRPPGTVTATERRRSQYAEGVLRQRSEREQRPHSPLTAAENWATVRGAVKRPGTLSLRLLDVYVASAEGGGALVEELFDACECSSTLPILPLLPLPDLAAACVRD
eukprot:COSAG04_NODE_3472_length_2790_cov_0.897808_1_plen_124_part_00